MLPNSIVLINQPSEGTAVNPDTSAAGEPLRIAMLGMIPGNGHPYSWSAIFNGYDKEAMARCPYAGIPVYLDASHRDELRVPNAAVTHIWTDAIEEARDVAVASLIPNVAEQPEAVIGEVDAVIISTDDGTDHVRRARPFVEAGLPVFVDKPLATTVSDLRQFAQWKRDGHRILSSSGMRYSPEIEQFGSDKWLWITGSTCKLWSRYAIHILEPLFKVLGPGFTEVSAIGGGQCVTANIRHTSGTRLTIAATEEAYGSFGVFHAYGGEGHKTVLFKDTYAAFRGQLLQVAEWFRGGPDPYPFSETIEMMAVIIAAQESCAENGRSVSTQSIIDQIQ